MKKNLLIVALIALMAGHINAGSEDHLAFVKDNGAGSKGSMVTGLKTSEIYGQKIPEYLDLRRLNLNQREGLPEYQIQQSWDPSRNTYNTYQDAIDNALGGAMKK